MLVDAIRGHRIWSRIYDAYPNPLLALERRVLLELLGPLAGLTIVDVACGTARPLPGASVIGMDLCPEMLALAAAKQAMRGRLAQACATRLPFRDACADLALCSFALGYFGMPQLAIGEMARIVRSGGRLVITDLHPRALAAGWKRSFRSGPEVYEMEHYAHPESCIPAAVAQYGFEPQHRLDAQFGTSELPIFARAGKQAAFAAASRIPAVRVEVWVKT